ncbi:MAG: hypothetical protein IJ206_13005 [Oscillospiraceae bacterium]|nr:hypothetical protein [Oscillospiraceae bacterium]
MAYKDKSQMYDYNNRFNSDNYDRISVLVPRGDRQRIKDHAERLGVSVNAFIRSAIHDAMERDFDTEERLIDRVIEMVDLQTAGEIPSEELYRLAEDVVQAHAYGPGSEHIGAAQLSSIVIDRYESERTDNDDDFE